MNSNNNYPIKIFVNNWNSMENKTPKTSNRITSTRYTWYSFIPVVLFQQFQIISNFYFLVNIVINSIIDSPLPFGVDIFPLSFLVFLSVIAKAFEEIKLHLSDKEINEQSTLSLRGYRFETSRFESLNVGDIVKCENNSSFPADLLLLFSSRETNDCSVTTVNLDGESSLKIFKGTIENIDESNISKTVRQMKMEINCIDSCEDLQKFYGTINFQTESETITTVLTEKNLLLRGAKLKNTEFIIGCVVYAGHNTKLSLNSKIKKIKSSIVDSSLNKYILIFLVIQILLAFLSCLISNVVYFNKEWFKRNWYVPSIVIGKWKQVEIFLAYFLLYNKLLPVSLIFSIYTLKGLASFFFNADLRMYDETIDQRARVNTIELIDELGQIEYLFSDKTGTLTENKMKFHCCSTGDKIYFDKENEIYCEISGDLKPIGSDFNDKLMDLFICLCLCHTVKVSNLDGFPNTNFTNYVDASELVYQACSPDEEAFLDSFRNYGIIYLGSKRNMHFISIFEEIQTYILRDVLPFDSSRKCMSVIVDYPDGSTRLICKGAETTLFSLTENTGLISSLMENLTRFSQLGLRVLVVAKKELTKEEADNILQNLNVYRSNPNLVDKEFEIYPNIENKLTLIGTTGVEDKLQEDVFQTINDLKEAGIKIWVITGDKEETAVNISLSAGHIDQEMFIHRITNITSQEQCINKLSLLSEELSTSRHPSHALVIDGRSFNFLVDPLLVDKFISICSKMKGTLCCRMTPLQKAQVVKIVKENVRPTPITAAVGDGGNDVSMILEAHVGIGIFGKEGRQAARIADYAIGKFKFLRPAILIHGQNFYIRLTTYIKLFFYKSVMYVNPIFFYSFLSALSTLNIYDTVGSAMYNLTFTTFPLVAYGILDKNHSDELFLQNPHFYKSLSRNSGMKFKDFLLSFLLSFFQSSLIFAAVYFAHSHGNGFVGKDGNSYDYYFFGLIIFYCIWGVFVAKVALLSRNISIIYLIFFFGNIFIGFSSQILYQYFTKDKENFLTMNTLSEPFSWLVIFVVIILCLCIDVILTLHRNYNSPHFD